MLRSLAPAIFLIIGQPHTLVTDLQCQPLEDGQPVAISFNAQISDEVTADESGWYRKLVSIEFKLGNQVVPINLQKSVLWESDLGSPLDLRPQEDGPLVRIYFRTSPSELTSDLDLVYQQSSGELTVSQYSCAK